MNPIKESIYYTFAKTGIRHQHDSKLFRDHTIELLVEYIRTCGYTEHFNWGPNIHGVLVREFLYVIKKYYDVLGFPDQTTVVLKRVNVKPEFYKEQTIKNKVFTNVIWVNPSKYPEYDGNLLYNKYKPDGLVPNKQMQYFEEIFEPTDYDLRTDAGMQEFLEYFIPLILGSNTVSSNQNIMYVLKALLLRNEQRFTNLETKLNSIESKVDLILKKLK